MLFTKKSFFTLGAKCNFLNLIGHLQSLPNHILAYHLFYIPWNIDGVQATRFGKETSFFNLTWLKGWKKIQKPYCTSTRHTLSYPKVSFVYYLFRWSSIDKPYTTENVIFHLHMTPGGKMKIPNPYFTSIRHAQSYLRVSIISFWKCRLSSSDKLYIKKKSSFSTLIWPLGIKWKFRNLIAHLQDMANNLLEYHWSSS